MSHLPGHRPAEHRVERECTECRQIDDHPRHVTMQFERHMDCCAALGCATCAKVVAESSGKQGAELVAHITGGAS